MAYGKKYSFVFESINGDTFEIACLKDGYSGSVIKRALGRAPVLQREKNGPVCGTSLSIYAQCDVDGEFSEFYTSDPRTWKIRLIRGVTVLFEGYIVPELYSEPDIAPPYDVQVVATDGLGELKRYDFAAQGLVTFSALLTYLLSKTGLNLSLYCNNSTVKSYEMSGIDTAARLLTNTYVNLDYLAGKSCYEVLTKLLDSLGAVIVYWDGHWQIFREANLGSGMSVRYGTASQNVAVTQFGSMTNCPWWAVGHMDREVVPAFNKQVVFSDAQYHNALNGSWSLTGNASYNPTLGAYIMVGHYAVNNISQTKTFEKDVKTSLKLKIKYSSEYNYSSSEIYSRVFVRISAQMQYYGSGGGYITRYLAKDNEGNYIWVASSSAGIFLDTSTPEYGAGMSSEDTAEIYIPLGQTNARDYKFAQSVSILIGSLSSAIIIAIYDCELVIADQIKGYKNTYNIDNGARESASDVESVFLPYQAGQEKTHPDFMYGITRVLSGSVCEATDIFDQIAEEYARCVSAVRMRTTGTLNTPAGATIPFALRDRDGLNYWLETFEWDLYNSEMRVSALSLPAASVTITDSSQEEISEGGTSGGGSGSSSSSGGGSGSGLTLADLYLEVTEYQPGHYALHVKPKAIHEGAEVNIDGLYTEGQLASGGLFSSGGSSGGSAVTWNQIVTTGTKIAEITIDGQTTDVKVPALSLAALTIGGKTYDGSMAVTVQSADIVSILGYTPYDSANPAGYLTSEAAALAYQPLLGYTPYNATNPNGYQANVLESVKVNGTALTITNKAVDVTVPTKTSELTNDSGFLTSASLANYYNTGNANLITVNWDAANLTLPKAGRLNLDANGSVYITRGTDTDTNLYIHNSGLNTYIESQTLHLQTTAETYLYGTALCPLPDTNNNKPILGSGNWFWGALYANRWYPDAADTGSYIEYDFANHAFKIVGNMYATGQIAAGGLISNS